MIKRSEGARCYITTDDIKVYPADFCIILSLIFIFLILLGEPLKNNAIVSLGSQGMIYSLLGFALVQFLSITQRKYPKYTGCFIAFCIVAMFSTLLSGPTAFLQKLIPLICFFMLPISLMLYKSVYNVSFVKRAIFGFNWIYTILFTIFSFSSFSHVYYESFGTKTVSALTLGYSNPNQTGMFLMISFIIAFCAFNRDIKKSGKIAYLIQSLWTFILLCGTLSRTCIILVVLALIMWAFKWWLKVGKKFTIICFMVPFIMALLLLFGGENVQKILILNEEFGAERKYVLGGALTGLTPITFIFGNFSKWIGSNLHNSYFTIFAIFGVAGLLVYLILLWIIVKDYFAQIDRESHSQTFAYLGVLILILHGSMESTLLTAGMVYSALFSLIFVLTLREEKI